MTTLDELIATEKESATQKWDFTAPAKKLEVNMLGDDLFVLATPQGRFGLEPHALTGLVEQVFVPSTYEEERYKNPKPTQRLIDHFYGNPNAVDKVNEWVRQSDKNVFIRMFDSNVRSVRSDTYSPYNNIDLLTQVQELLDEEYEIGHYSKLNRDDLSIPISFAQPIDGNYGYGMLVKNSEVAAVSVSFTSMIQRFACSNSLASLPMSIRYRHVGSVINRLRDGFGTTMHRTKTSAEQLVNAMQQAEQVPIKTDMQNVMAGVTKRLGTENMLESAMYGTERQNSLFGVVNGVTWLAKHVLGRRSELESAAGDLLKMDNEGKLLIQNEFDLFKQYPPFSLN